ncbi:MAG: sulfatase-like hydrolase/transferase [Bacteroidetes bacterium]|nr:sulfatase-like hydrolase/transferase [Bacteroidota bacterium]
MRFIAPYIVGLALLFGLLSPLVAQESPNILFIMSDDHSFRSIGAYNESLKSLNITPHIDQLAAQGAMFTNSVCTNSLCSPSRASIITGMYSHHNGVYTLREHLNGEYLPTLAKELKKAGYSTAAVGKWHVEGDNLQGYDYYAITHGQGSYWNPTMTTKEGKLSRNGYTTDAYTDVAMEWLDSRDKAQPFFLMVHQKATHAPWHYDTITYPDFLEGIEIPEPINLMDDYANRDVNGVLKKQHKIHDYLNPDNTNKDILSKDFADPSWVTGSIDTIGMSDVEILKACYQKYMHDYLSCVKSVDDNVGRMVSKLRDEGILENTIIIYTSDQGMFLGEHNFYDKRLGLEEALRMPLILSYPGKIARDTVIDELVNIVDFAPTFLEMAGASIPSEMQGISFRDLVYGQTPDTLREASFYHFYSSSCPKHIGIRTKTHKMLVYLGKKNGDILGYDLYDLVNDPYEMNSIYEDLSCVCVASEMHEKLEAEMRAIGFSEGLYPGKDQKNIDRRVVVQLAGQEGAILDHGNVRFNNSSDHAISENGYANIYNVVPGTYTLQAEATGYEPYSGTITIEPRPNYKQANDTLFSLQLSPMLYLLEVMVSNSLGPHPGATVRVNEQSYTTDGAGKIETTGIPSGQYTISIDAEGYETMSDTISIQGENLSMEYLLSEIQTGMGKYGEQLKIYPNPASGTLFIEGARIGSALKIFNIKGMVVRAATTHSPLEVVDVADWPDGSYILAVDGLFRALIQIRN